MMELSDVLFSAKYWFNLDGQGNVATFEKGRVTVLYYKWPTFTVKNRL